MKPLEAFLEFSLERKFGEINWKFSLEICRKNFLWFRTHSLTRNGRENGRKIGVLTIKLKEMERKMEKLFWGRGCKIRYV